MQPPNRNITPAGLFTRCLLAYSIDVNQYRSMSKSQLPIVPVQSCTAAPIVREPLTAQTAAELAGVFKAKRRSIPSTGCGS